MIAEVIPEKRTSPGHDTFSYLVPENLEGRIQIGSIVEVPFGKKSISGVIASIKCHLEVPGRSELDSGSMDSTGFRIESGMTKGRGYELKEIKSINPNFVVSKEYLDVSKWVSKYYLCSLGEAVALFLPPKISRPRKAQASNCKAQETSNIQLTTEQEEIFEKLKINLSEKNKKPALIFGVTGSGKTEIYLKLAAETLKEKKQVVVLVPEIMLTPQTVEKFEKVFPTNVCIMHSGLATSERYNCYKQFYAGEKSIIIGPRSALLIPNNNIGLILIDEEQEDAYKQEHDPRYHAVDLAQKIAEKIGALLVLGTATPRIETYHKAKTGEYDLCTLLSRYQKLLLPPAKIVDLKDEIKQDNYSPVSLELQRNIERVLKSKRHIILFLNRRGVATFVSCRECGEVILCPNCDIPMVYHVNFDNHVLNCHHCDKKLPVPTFCPSCASTKIKFFGAGVDKIESEIIRLFPTARVRKIDAKSLQNKNEYMKLYDDFKSGKIDILIGTQILAKGLDIGTVDLVGVISADTGLHLPYFRANEKTFSLITQVSGRSGRKDNVGQTIIQTYWPDSSAIKMAANHDYEKFYNQEVLERETFNYPPFCHLIRVVSENKTESSAKSELSKVSAILKQEGIDHIGPAKCFMSKINNKFRYHLIIKTKSDLDPKIAKVYESNPYLVWDKDPTNLL